MIRLEPRPLDPCSIVLTIPSCGLFISSSKLIGFPQRRNNIRQLLRHIKNSNSLEFKVQDFIIWPVQPRALFTKKTISKMVPHEGRTRRNDRAGTTRKAPQVKRKFPQNRCGLKLMTERDLFQQNFDFFQNERWDWTFWQRILLSVSRKGRCRTT